MAHEIEVEDRTVDLANASIHLLAGGAGPDLLVLHHDVGPMGWTRFHALLAPTHRVYAPDMPGFGDSPRLDWTRHPRDLAAVMLAAARRLGLRDYILVGLGFGGWVAAEMAAYAHPEMARLVLAAPAGIKPDTGFILDQMLEEPVAYLRAGFSEPAIFDAFVPDPQATELKDRLDACRETIARVAWRPYMYSYELPETLREARLPVTIAWGESDAVIPAGCADRWAEVLPECTVHVIPGTGHFLDLECPERLAAIVSETPVTRARKE
jgi:pimeloyl-ACP methyl ester carboxylesterase